MDINVMAEQAKEKLTELQAKIKEASTSLDDLRTKAKDCSDSLDSRYDKLTGKYSYVVPIVTAVAGILLGIGVGAGIAG